MIINLTLFILTFLDLSFQPENLRFEERLDMRSGYHAAKILPVGVRDTTNVWCLSSLLASISSATLGQFVAK